MSITSKRLPCGLASLLALASLLGAPGGCGDDGAGQTTTRGTSEDGTTHDGDASDGETTPLGTSGSSAGDTTQTSSSGSSAGDTGSTGTATTQGDGTTTTQGETDTDEPLAPGGTIIPLYTYPTDPTWQIVAAAKQAYSEVDVVAIINPNSGPGAGIDPSYDAGITALQDAGVTVIGYVYTSYADRPPAVVQADISAYAAFYPQLDGIMLDEMSNMPGDEAYYADLSGFASDLGLGFTVGNPGTSIPESFVDTVDVLFVYEGVGLPDPMGLDDWIDAYERERFAIIPHSAPGLDAGFVGAALEHVGWIYATDDVLPNPWDSLPPYFDALMQQLAAG